MKAFVPGLALGVLRCTSHIGAQIARPLRQAVLECALDRGVERVEAVQRERLGRAEAAAGRGIGAVVAQDAVLQRQPPREGERGEAAPYRVEQVNSSAAETYSSSSSRSRMSRSCASVSPGRTEASRSPAKPSRMSENVVRHRKSASHSRSARSCLSARLPWPSPSRAPPGGGRARTACAARCPAPPAETVRRRSAPRQSGDVDGDAHASILPPWSSAYRVD